MLPFELHSGRSSAEMPCTESILNSRLSGGRSCGTIGAKDAANCVMSVGGGGPVKRPVDGSIVHACDAVSCTLSSPTIVDVRLAITWFGALFLGTTGFVTRGDSSELGPETTEFTSNAVTE